VRRRSLLLAAFLLSVLPERAFALAGRGSSHYARPSSGSRYSGGGGFGQRRYGGGHTFIFFGGGGGGGGGILLLLVLLVVVLFVLSRVRRARR
jgi:uncharacterized membrane protein